MKFENDLLKPENQTNLRNALIEWCIGSDGQNGATCDILGNITWTMEMENIKSWGNGVCEKIDNAIGARMKVDGEIITDSHKREVFLHYIDRKVENIIKAYQEVIDELNSKYVPLFKTYDIIQNKVNGKSLIVMDFTFDKHYNNDYLYFLDNYNGLTVTYCKSYIENNFRKIGEVTKDVLKEANPNLK